MGGNALIFGKEEYLNRALTQTCHPTQLYMQFWFHQNLERPGNKAFLLPLVTKY